MDAVASLALVSAAALLCIPVGVFSIEIFAALLLSHRRRAADSQDVFRPNLAVLVPAHNEGVGLLPTLLDIKRELADGDRLIVVADNCTDDTAVVAAQAGAEVVERNDSHRHGKGYALDCGIRHMSADPPDVVVIVDADCRLADGAVDQLVRTCVIARRPAQALYLMTAPEAASINYRVAEFAWVVKNHLRPAGLQALRLPCQLMGTGMAFPWDVIRAADLANGNVVEDLKLGLDLAAAGSPPLFCQSAVLRSHFPHSTRGGAAQRRRWEHGHINMISSSAPRLAYAALARRNLPLLALTLDLIVPPLSLLILLVAGGLVVSGLAALAGVSRIPLLISSVALLTLTMSVAAAWWVCGREILPVRTLPLITEYIAGKAGSYPRAIFRKSRLHWTRADRQ